MGYDTAFWDLRKRRVSNVRPPKRAYVLDKRLTVADADEPAARFDVDHACRICQGFASGGDAKIMDLLNRSSGQSSFEHQQTRRLAR